MEVYVCLCLTDAPGGRVAKTFKTNADTLIYKRSVLANLEAALGPVKLAELKEETERAGGIQFRPHMVEAPSRIETLKKIREEESDKMIASGVTERNARSHRLTGSVGINMGLDLEMRQ